MTNTFAVCLLGVLFCCTNLSLARQLPPECAKGPSFWCTSLKTASDCAAVGHCTSTVWETQVPDVHVNNVSKNFVRLFRQLKDVKDLINEDYLATRISSECLDAPHVSISTLCTANTEGLEKYMFYVLKSAASPETLCSIIGMCNKMKEETLVAIENKQTEQPKRETEHKKLLGNAKCTWGPAYWCSNISTSHDCKATHHCVAKVWSKMNYAHDNDSICKICTDMVKQARDQLQSNETQEELKQVFEGSCKLIPIKIVAKECIKMADEFVPDLVETLSSEMNPQTVCTVAGLCNNEKIDAMLAEYNSRLQLQAGCNNCSRAVGAIRKKFDATSYEDFLVSLLRICRNMDSLSDSCSMLVFKYYENILEAVKKDLNSKSMCHVSGQCSYMYHSHDENYVFPQITDEKDDDVPCELCEQLVKHLRDTLVANTTEVEFYKVLQGLCKQTGKFKDECLHIAEQYYPLIYKFLTEDMKPTAICNMIGVCHSQDELANAKTEQIAVLLPKELNIKAQKMIGDLNKPTDAPKVARVPLTKQTNVRVVAPETSNADVAGVLPIERMFIQKAPSKTACSFCQYFLHYLQVELSDTNTIERVTEAVDHACEKLPKSVNGECKEFIEQYGPTVIAMLVQEIDPASVCPALGLCPQTESVRRVAINADKSSCPLCLFAVEQLKTMIKDDRSEAGIRKALDTLCSHLSQKLRTNCIDFVDTYTQQLVEMLVADLDPQEICVYLKLCNDEVHDPLKLTTPSQSIDTYHEQPKLMADRNNFKGKSLLPKHMLETGVGGDIETNEIPDNTVNGRTVVTGKPKTTCIVCEFVLKELDDQIKDKHNRDEIMNKVHGICKHMPKSVRNECDQFVEKYGELVISLLAQELDPSKVCEELKLCPPSNINAIKAEEILDCAVCETVVVAVKKVLANDRVDHNIVHIVEKSCALLPAKYSTRCHTMMEIYGDSVVHLIEQMGARGVCRKIGLCSEGDAAFVRIHRRRH